MTPAIVFRAEASNRLGLGHMFRCLNFVRSLPMEVRPFFVMRGCLEQEKVTRVLKENNWCVCFLPHKIDTLVDATETIKIAKKYNAKLIVTDLCHRYLIEKPDELIFYHQYLKKSSAFVLSIEDCRMSGFASNSAVIWNSNSGIELNKKTLDGCKILAGTRYFICDPKFSSLGSKGYGIREKANRILVCIGGSDPKGITSKILKAIKKLKAQNIKARVIVGDGVLKKMQKEIDCICQSSKSISIIRQTNSMVELLKWADIAIVGEGLVKYEAAIVGIPSLMIPQFDYDSKPILEFLMTGCSRRLGESIDITGAISDLLMDFESRKKMSLSGLNNFDGRGMERIYFKVLKNVFKNI